MNTSREHTPVSTDQYRYGCVYGWGAHRVLRGTGDRVPGVLVQLDAPTPPPHCPRYPWSARCTPSLPVGQSQHFFPILVRGAPREGTGGD